MQLVTSTTRPKPWVKHGPKQKFENHCDCCRRYALIDCRRLARVATSFLTVLFRAFCCDLCFKNEMNAWNVDYEEKPFTLVSSSMMLCCSRTCSFRKATSCSSCAWSRSFKDLSFFSGGWELIFSLCNAPTEKRDRNVSRWSDNNKNTQVIQARLSAHHLKVLLCQALELLLHLLNSLSQIIIPFIQQFVLVQQGFTLLLWLSNTLQLVKRRDAISLS